MAAFDEETAMLTISDVAHAYRVAGKSTTPAIPLSHIQQLIAAALGHGSLAAYQASEHESGHLDDVGYIVFDYELLAERANQLAIPYSYSQVELLIQEAFAKAVPNAAQFRTEVDLSQALRDFFQDRILNSDCVSGRMAETNGDGITEVYVEEEDEYGYSNLPSGELTNLFLNGQVTMGISDERPYAGHIIDFEVHLVLERTGLRSVGDPTCKVTNAKVRSWSAPEEEPEMPQPQMEIGKTYDVVFAAGSYEIEYENNVRCIKKTPKSYRVERPNGTTRLVGQEAIFELKEVQLDNTQKP